MRAITLTLALCLAAAIGIYSATLSDGRGTNAEAFLAHRAFGILIAILFLLGAAYVLNTPRVSTFIFAIASILAFTAGWEGDFLDMYLGGSMSLALALMSYLGVREPQKKQEHP